MYKNDVLAFNQQAAQQLTPTPGKGGEIHVLQLPKIPRPDRGYDSSDVHPHANQLLMGFVRSRHPSSEAGLRL